MPCQIPCGRLLRYWRQAALTADSQRQRVQLLAQLCEWLDRPELRSRCATPGKAEAEAEAPPCPWSEARIQERLQAIRAIDERAALHLELVRVRDDPPSGRGAATGHGRPRRCPGRALGSPCDQVLRFPIAGERQRAVLDAGPPVARTRRGDGLSARTGAGRLVRRVHDLMRTVGGIGVPGEPTRGHCRTATPRRLKARDAWLLGAPG